MGLCSSTSTSSAGTGIANPEFAGGGETNARPGTARQGRHSTLGPLLHSTLPGARGEVAVRAPGRVVLQPGSFLFEVSLSSICTRNLTAKDLMSSDPFVRLHWGTHALHETRYFKRSQVKARFPETFSFVYASTLAELAVKELAVEVLDWNASGHHTPIGTTKVGLKQIACGPVHHDHELLSPDGKAAGRVSFNCTMQTTDSWKVSVKGVHVIYKSSVLKDPRFKGCPFRLQYRYIDYLSRAQSPTHALDFEVAKRAFGTMRVITWNDDQLEPLRWGGSFLKFITGSLQFELFSVETDSGNDRDAGHYDDNDEMIHYVNRFADRQEEGGGSKSEGAEEKLEGGDNGSSVTNDAPKRDFASLAKAVTSFAREKLKREKGLKRRLSSRDSIVLNETASGTLWLSLKRLYSMSTWLGDMDGIDGSEEESYDSTRSLSPSIVKPRKHHISLSADQRSKKERRASSSTVGTLALSSKTSTHSLALSSAQHSPRRKATRSESSASRRTHWMRRQAEFDEDLWLDGQKVGTISGTMVFERVPPIGQMASGVMTENGTAAASPVIVGEKRGGTIFRLLSGQKTGALPEAVKSLGKTFGDLSHLDVRKNGSEKKQRRKLKRLTRMLQGSDKFSMLSWVYSDFEGLFSTQKLLLTIGNWLMDRVEAVETSYEIMRLSFVGIVLVLSRGELSDLSTLGFDPMNSARVGQMSSDNVAELGKAAQKAQESGDGLPPGVSNEQLDIAVLIRKFLVRCLRDSVKRVRFKIKGSRGSLRLCAKIFAICSFRIPEFGACMARAFVTQEDVRHPISAWQKTRDVPLDDLSERCAVSKDASFESYFQTMGFPQELRSSYGLSLCQSAASKSTPLRQRSLVHSAHMHGDPATMMMDWRRLSLVLRRHREPQIKKQNAMLPKSCLNPELVDCITNEAATRERRRRVEKERLGGRRHEGSNVRRAASGNKITMKTKSIIGGTRAAPIDVDLKIEDFPDMEAYRTASRLQQELILEQGWVLRLRNRQHLFLLVAQEWIQEVIDVVALVQRNIQWYQIPWYNHVLKGILMEMDGQAVRSFSESLVLLSRALISNPDIISPLVRSVTRTTQARSLADVTLGLAMIRSWFVAMSSWHLRRARGVYTLGGLNRSSLPADFQFDYLTSVMLKLFDNSLPFQVTQKALEFLYSVWDVIPSERAEIMRKKLLVSGTFLNLMLHWESHVRRFFAYLMAARLLLRRKWCRQGGMPAVHFEDFVDSGSKDNDPEQGNISEDESSDEDSSDDEITIHTFASSSSSLDVTVGAAKAVLEKSGPYGAGEGLDNSPRSTHSSDPGSSPYRKGKSENPNISGPPRLFLGAPDSGLLSTRFSVVHNIDSDHPHTPTAAGKEHPRGSRVVMLTERSQMDLLRDHSGESPLSSVSEKGASNLTESFQQEGQDSRTTSTLSSQSSTSSKSGKHRSMSSSSVRQTTEAMERMAAMIRILRRKVRDYESRRVKAWAEDAERECWEKDTLMLDATTRPGDEFHFGSSVDELHHMMYKMKVEELTKDEVEFGNHVSPDSYGGGGDGNGSSRDDISESCWGQDLDQSSDSSMRIHPLLGGECLDYLLDERVQENDEACLKRGIMWDAIEKPGSGRLAYAKDALRMYTLAARRIYALHTRVKRAERERRMTISSPAPSKGENDDSMVLSAEDLQVPELTFVALVKDEKGMYKNATLAKKDTQSDLD